MGFPGRIFCPVASLNIIETAAAQPKLPPSVPGILAVEVPMCLLAESTREPEAVPSGFEVGSVGLPCGSEGGSLVAVAKVCLLGLGSSSSGMGICEG